MDFGDNFYVSHDSEPPYGPPGGPAALPAGVYEVSLPKPLGIEFREQDAGGLKVVGLVPEGSAAASGAVAVGDELVGITAVRLVGAKWERQMFPCAGWKFDTVVDAIGSNNERFSCSDVVLQLRRGEGEESS